MLRCQGDSFHVAGSWNENVHGIFKFLLYNCIYKNTKVIITSVKIKAKCGDGGYKWIKQTSLRRNKTQNQ